MLFYRATMSSVVSERREAGWCLVIALAAEWNFEPSEGTDESCRAVRGRDKRAVLRECVQPLHRSLCRFRQARCPGEATRSTLRHSCRGGFGWDAFHMDRTRLGVSGWEAHGAGFDRRCTRFLARGS